MLYSQAPPDISSFKEVLSPADPEPIISSLEEEEDPFSLILDQMNSNKGRNIDLKERASIVQYTSSISIGNQ